MKGKVPKLLVLAFFVFLAVVPGNVIAHPPATVECDYDFESQTLSVTIAHDVGDPNSHYIYEVEVLINSVTYDTFSYGNQPASPFTYDYNIPALDGDVIQAIARCSISGSGSGQTTVVEPDTAPPSVTIESPLNSETVSSSRINVNGNASDNKEVTAVEVSVNDGPWESSTGTTSWDIDVNLNLGSNSIKARSTDSSGNMGYHNITVTYTDATSPTIMISTPTQGTEFSAENITVSGTASDNEALDKVEVSLNSGAWLLASGTSSWSILE